MMSQFFMNLKKIVIPKINEESEENPPQAQKLLCSGFHCSVFIFLWIKSNQLHKA